MIELRPKTPAVLDRLHNGCRLATISNTGDDLITGPVAAISAPIGFVVTAQRARACKPDHRLFHHAHFAIGMRKPRLPELLVSS